MEESKEDALQAALLAKFVSGSLNKIDSLSVDARSRANRIDVNQFVSKVVNNNQGQQYNQNMGQPPIPRGFAAPPPEDIIRQMVPDVPKHQPPPPQQQSNPSSELSNSHKIESILSNIDKNLEILVKFIKND
jgi:hypothetical protein